MLIRLLILTQFLIGWVIPPALCTETELGDDGPDNTVEDVERVEMQNPRPKGGAGGRNRPGLWVPRVGSTWQIVLSTSIDFESKTSPLAPDNVGIFDVDLFDTPKSSIQALKDKGKKVICYFSAGTSEEWRPDFESFKPEHQGAALPLWPGEMWLDIRNPDIFDIMKKRIRYASEKGCDAVDPDNLDGYSNEKGGGFAHPLKEQDGVRYFKQLSRESRRLGMSIGLKNAQEIMPRVEGDLDFVVNEQCAEDEVGGCDEYRALVNPRSRRRRAKAVFHIEYANHTKRPIEISQNGIASTSGFKIELGWMGRNVSSATLLSRLCLQKKQAWGGKLSTVTKELSLDGWVLFCDGSWAETKTKLIGGRNNLRRSIRSDDAEFEAIMEQEDEPHDAAAEAALDAEVELAMSTPIDDEWVIPKSISSRKPRGAMKDRLPSSDFLESNPGWKLVFR